MTLERLRTAAQILADAFKSISHASVEETTASSTPPPAAPGNALNPLLAIKLHLPHLRAQLVHRAHLVKRLQEEGARASLTLVSAPPGFGKTTLLAQWLAQCGTPVAWLSLESEDNDPVRFLIYLIAALQTVDVTLGTVALELLHASQPPPLQTLITLLANDLMHSRREEIALVLDDYHVITTESIHLALTSLVERMPPQMHLLIATRADPPLPLSRLRARGHLLELRTAHLRFSSEEASAFLHITMGLDLSHQALETLERHTEGWIAGLQLAALSLQGRVDVASFLSAFSGSHRFVLDYLTDEVLARQPTRVQAFLLYTSILERLSGSLCDQVTGQERSQIMLEALDRANMFVVPLDEERQWYRYHHLFAEVLQNRLQQAEPHLVPELHQRASAWYEQHELPIEVIQHALAAPDFERAASLIEAAALPLGQNGQLYTVLGWLDALPAALVSLRPFLCIYQAAMLINAARLVEAQSPLQNAERCVQEDLFAEQAHRILGMILALRSVIAVLSDTIPQALSLAHQSLDLLPETDVIARSSSIQVAAHSYFVSGNVTAATEREVVAAEVSTRSSGNLIAVVRGISLLARLYVLQGRLREATIAYERVPQLVPRPEILQALVISSLFYCFGLGELQYAKNDLTAAEQSLAQGMDMVKDSLTVEPYAAAMGYVTLARLHHARGDSAGALATLDAFTQLAYQQHFASHWMAHADAVRAQIELAQGKLSAAISWADASGLSCDDVELPYPREREYLTLARVYIAQGREDPAGLFLPNALHLLERLLLDAEVKARMGSALEILVLRALAFQAQNKEADALTTLERAFTLSAPEGSLRLFVDEGAPMLALVRRVQAPESPSEYVARLLSAFGEPTSATFPSTSRRGGLVEPLTERELDVLRLLVAGLSNAAIAQELIITVGTVKRHVNSLYSKLGVSSRAQAIARNHTLRLL